MIVYILRGIPKYTRQNIVDLYKNGLGKLIIFEII
jgi:hypothetical protein